MNADHAAESKYEDELAPASSWISWQADVAVKLHMAKSGPAAEPPQTVMSFLRQAADSVPQHVALAEKVGGVWVKYTYQEYYHSVRRVAKAFIKLGLEERHGVGIIGFNSPEWIFADLAAIFAGGLAVGIYATNSPDACRYVAENAQCNLVVVENDQQLKKFLQIRDSLPLLKAIIQYKGSINGNYPSVYSWDDMLKMADDENLEQILQERIRAQAPNKCCTLIYTSGTTGDPKGVMLSHDNLVWTGKLVALLAKTQSGKEITISFLPLSHVAAQQVYIYQAIACCAAVYFAQPDAFKGSLVTTLKEVRPTIFLGVPRVWEKIQEAMMSAGKSNGRIAKKIASWARNIGLEGNKAALNGGSKPLLFGVADILVFSKVRAALGLDRCKLCLSGAAPLSRHTLEFFMSLNIPIMEVYGMSESSGMQSFNMAWSYKLGSVGKATGGIQTIIPEYDDEGVGEVCIEGRHVCMGYYNMKDETRASIDENGRLYSGDIGKTDDDGFLYITGRLKELIVTAGGENVAPVPIEDRVKQALPCVSNCMLVGDRRKFLSILLTLKTEVCEETFQPSDRLLPAVVEWCRSNGSEAQTVGDVQNDVSLHRVIQSAIDDVNKAATSRAQCVQKWTILPRDFSVHGGEIGPTMKLKRPFVENLYEKTIDDFYSADDLN